MELSSFFASILSEHVPKIGEGSYNVIQTAKEVFLVLRQSAELEGKRADGGALVGVE